MDILFDGDRFFSGPDPSKPLAEITFKRLNYRQLEVDHTFTDPSLRGQGIARRLVEKVAQYARVEGFKVSATCPYARRVLSEEEFKDIYAA